MVGVAHFITGHKQTQLKRVCCFYLFGVFLASKFSDYSKLIDIAVVVVVVLLFYVHGKHLRSCRDSQFNLTTLFMGRLRPPKRLTITSCTYFRQ